MNSKDYFYRAIELFNYIMSNVRDEHWNNPTPCSEWNVKALVNHLTNEASWVPDLMEGKTIAEVGNKYDGDLLGGDPVQAWKDAMIKAVESVELVDEEKTVHLSYGDFPAKSYLNDNATDYVIHSWDLIKGINLDFHLPEDLSEIAYNFIAPVQKDMVSYGIYKEEQPVNDNATWEEKLIAKSGRKFS